MRHMGEVIDTILVMDECNRMILDNIFFGVDELIDLAEMRIKRGDSPAAVFADLGRAMRIMRKGLE